MSSAHPEANKMELNKNKMMNFFMGRAPIMVFLIRLKHHLGWLTIEHYRELQILWLVLELLQNRCVVVKTITVRLLLAYSGIGNRFERCQLPCYKWTLAGRSNRLCPNKIFVGDIVVSLSVWNHKLMRQFGNCRRSGFRRIRFNF